MLKVGSGNPNSNKLDNYDLHERSLDKIDAKLYFSKLKLNEVIKRMNNWDNYTDDEKELIRIRYEATDREVQVLEYIYNKIKGIW
mgnify:CR=1 FL=1